MNEKMLPNNKPPVSEPPLNPPLESAMSTPLAGVDTLSTGGTAFRPQETIGAGQRRPFARMPLRIMFPTLVTLLALCMGLYAIRFAIEKNFEMAILFVVAAAILDGLDGRIARALKGTSRFGGELDSLTDFVNFGVAPALILYLWDLSRVKNLGWFACLVFAIACALRLARFNVMAEDPAAPAWTQHFFVGMPAPAGGIASLLPVYWHFSHFSFSQNPPWVPFIEISYVLLIALLMTSRIPHWSGKKITRIPREYFLVILFGVAVLLLLLGTFPMEILAAITILYLLCLPLSIWRYSVYHRFHAPR